MLKTYLQNIFFEDTVKQLDKVVVYQGRFSPITLAHTYVYSALCKEFGQQNVYILTADPKVLDDKNPFTFQEKKEMMIAAGIPEPNIKQIKGSAYKWEVIADAVGITNPDKTVIISAMGQKDAEERTKYGTYYSIYNSKIPLIPMTDHGYIKVLANMNIEGTDTPVNASSIRQAILDKDVNIIKQNVEPGVFNWLQKKYLEK